MNREAVALGVPVYTTFAGQLGAVDDALIAEGRLRPLRSTTRAPARETSADRGASPAVIPRCCSI